MDMKLSAMDTTSDYPTWDVSVKDNIVPILTNEASDMQDATLACLLEYGSIPQLLQRGVDWTSFLTGEKTFGMIDAEIRESLRLAGFSEYRPDYQIQGDRLTLVVTKEG